MHEENKTLTGRPGSIAKPFLKWAGGKTQLIEAIQNHLPDYFNEEAVTFIEPFVGSGAVFFWMMAQYPNIKKAVINDINNDLTNCYLSIKHEVEDLITLLSSYQSEYHTVFLDKAKSKRYYYEKRDLFNARNADRTVQSALFIFLNKTCFNGLYRVNSSNAFNVPVGRSKSLPKICDAGNLRAVSAVLQKTVILNGDYSETLNHADDATTFFYFDPPYKPLSETSSFNTYAKNGFNDGEQVRLKEFCDTLNTRGHQWLLSNSDMKNVNPQDNFFDDLYKHFRISRVYAKRSINANGAKRGRLTELLITNVIN